MLSDILRGKVDKWIAKSRQEDREKALARGLAEGRVEIQKLWLVWNRRRLAHEAMGEPFDEPPPSLNGDNGHRGDGSGV